MNLLRSEEMGLYTISIESNSVRDVVETLGNSSCLHFIDANKPGTEKTRYYWKLMQRCYGTFSKIKIIAHHCRRHAIPLVSHCSAEGFMATLQEDLERRGMNSIAYFEAAEQELREGAEYLTAQQKKAKEAADRCTSLIEKQYVLTRAADIIMTHAKYCLVVK